MVSTSWIMGIVIGAVFAAIALPVALNATFNVDTSGWGEIGGLWILVPLVILASVIGAFMSRGSGSD